MALKKFNEYTKTINEEDSSLNYNQNKSYYVEEQLNMIKNKILNLFEEPKEGSEEVNNFYTQGLVIMDVKFTDMPLYKTLVMKYQGDEFLYHLYITIDRNQADIHNGEFNSSDIKYCGVKLKKYDLEENLLGELDRQKTLIEDINQDYLDKLNVDLDSKYSLGDNFEIET